MDFETKLSMVVVAICTAIVMSMPTPSFALGACGPNRHRNPAGYCVPGGQNQDWCLRAKGHPATRMPDGTVRCL